RIVDETEGLKVVGKAENGQALLDMLKTTKPDVILLDIEMPVMNGIEFLKKRQQLHIDVPVVILSSVATEGASVTIQCLELGASDFITKPGGSVTLKIADVTKDIIEYVASYGGAYALLKGKNVPVSEFFSNQIKLKEAERFVLKKKGEEAAKLGSITKADALPASLWAAPKKKENVSITPLRESGKIEIIAIGISTGGPNALREVFKNIDANIKQPILVVQHMPAGFTAEFASSLNNICPLPVSEAKDGEPLLGGHVYIAQGAHHMFVEKKAFGYFIKLSQDEPRNGHRPSVDVLFESVAKLYQNRALGVIMTGMGKDGAAELAEMRKQGAWTLGQDKETSIVYGMPKVAFELGGVQKQVPLKDMAKEISRLAKENQ
ncbi:MAG: chemotaxis response regulator protein-glutamate methylesterase, partial [Treponema sp.]|nr:chemotaxis response regulator protein-glutamate methylesterase [Treponema sp.]